MKITKIRPRFSLFLLTVVWWSLTPLWFYLADMERGYDGTGGEALLPLLPVLVWMFIKSFKD